MVVAKVEAGVKEVRRFEMDWDKVRAWVEQGEQEKHFEYIRG